MYQLVGAPKQLWRARCIGAEWWKHRAHRQCAWPGAGGAGEGSSASMSGRVKRLEEKIPELQTKLRKHMKHAPGPAEGAALRASMAEWKSWKKLWMPSSRPRSAPASSCTRQHRLRALLVCCILMRLGLSGLLHTIVAWTFRECLKVLSTHMYKST